MCVIWLELLYVSHGSWFVLKDSFRDMMLRIKDGNGLGHRQLAWDVANSGIAAGTWDGSFQGTGQS